MTPSASTVASKNYNVIIKSEPIVVSGDDEDERPKTKNENIAIKL